MSPASTADRHAYPVWVGYAMAIGAVAVLLALRQSLHGYLGDRVPFTFFMLSAMLAAWFGGIGPGITATLLGLVAGEYFFTVPAGELGIYKPIDVIQHVMYLLPTLVAVALLEALHRTTRKLQMAIDSARQELDERLKTHARSSARKLNSRATRNAWKNGSQSGLRSCRTPSSRSKRSPTPSLTISEPHCERWKDYHRC